jgi:threonine dehydratase
MSQRPFVREVGRAAGRIQAAIVLTPLEFSPGFSRSTGARVYVKWECDQTTGSFKLRGALNKIRALSAPQRRKGIVTASTGNHGLAVNHAAKLEGVPLEVFLPETARPVKVDKLRRAGASLAFYGQASEVTEVHARAEAESSGRVFVSPYNDIDVVYGQGTIGRELFADLPRADAVIVPVGGGGLIAGIGGYLKNVSPGLRLVGVEPARSAFLKAALTAGRLVPVRERETVADAVAGGLEPGTLTFPLVQDYVDEIVTVSETGIVAALRATYEEHGRIVEGAGALALAALMKKRAAFRGKTVVLVVSGKNIDPKTFETLTGRI